VAEGGTERSKEGGEGESDREKEKKRGCGRGGW